MTLQTLIDEAKKLNEAERAELFDAVIVSPPASRHTREAVELTPAQSADLARRREELRAGRMEVIDGEQVRAMFRAKGQR